MQEGSDAEGFTLNIGVAEESVVTAGDISSTESTYVNGCLTSFGDRYCLICTAKFKICNLIRVLMVCLLVFIQK